MARPSHRGSYVINSSVLSACQPVWICLRKWPFMFCFSFFFSFFFFRSAPLSHALIPAEFLTFKL